MAPDYPTFYIDDSTAVIGGRKHVILAAISFPNEEEALSEWLRQKQLCGLPSYEEVKWGDRSIPFERRREFVPALNRGVGIAVVHERDKQAAALEIVKQIWFYCQVEEKDGFRVRFDRGIIQDWGAFRKSVNFYVPPCVGASEHDSAAEQLLQYADFLAGCIKLKLDFGSGLRDPNNKINDPDLGETDLGSFFFAALRYCLWGDVKDYGEPGSPLPRKCVWNRGLVIASSLPRDTIESVIAFLDGDYMGCIH